MIRRRIIVKNNKFSAVQSGSARYRYFDSPHRFKLFLELFNGKKSTATLELTAGKSLPSGSRSSGNGTAKGKVVVDDIRRLHGAEDADADSETDGEEGHHSIGGKANANSCGSIHVCAGWYNTSQCR